MCDYVLGLAVFMCVRVVCVYMFTCYGLFGMGSLANPTFPAWFLGLKNAQIELHQLKSLKLVYPWSTIELHVKPNKPLSEGLRQEQENLT